MNIGIIAPSPVPYQIGGAEKLWWGLLEHINQCTNHRAELIKLPTKEADFWQLIESYGKFCNLDVSHFDLVISGKYPSWMIDHPNHICYLLHKLRGLYDTYHFFKFPTTEPPEDPRLKNLQVLMERNQGSRKVLPAFFECLVELRALDDLPAGTFDFPGPLAREVIHFLDGIGLSPEHIKRYAAISQRVARRQGYFPEGTKVCVAYPPSNLTGFWRGESRHLLSVGRLDRAKRTYLAIEAMKHVKANIPLKVVGTGPDEALLRKSSHGDSRIEFLGFKTDSELVSLYSNCLAVVYAPRDEDYGLVAIEAMMSEKPVVTTTDAGGPLEFVKNEQTGFVVPPEPESIAERIEHLCERPDEARSMGLKGKEGVRGITWSSVLDELLRDQSLQAPAMVACKRRKKISVCTTFPVFPPRGGGQMRVFHLFRHLARSYEIELVTLCNNKTPAFAKEIAPGMTEIRVPQSQEHKDREKELSRQLGWIPVTDVAMPTLYSLTPAYLETFGRSAREADHVVLSHPYLLPALREVTSKPFWYEAQDVEIDLKRNIFPQTPEAEDLLRSIKDVEASACAGSEFILVCSENDAGRLESIYEADSEKMAIVPNGVDLESISFVPPEQRRKEKRTLGLGDEFLLLFMGSWHLPNLEAVEHLTEIAAQMSNYSFIVLGSVGNAFQNRRFPSNMTLTGAVNENEKLQFLRIADVGLNPVCSGSGTNLKMLEYCAAGLPVVSTPYGARGLELSQGRHIDMVELEEFPQALSRVRNHWDKLGDRVDAARACVEKRYDWKVISKDLTLEISRRFS